MLMTLILAALAAAVVDYLVPRLDGGRMAGYVRTVGGLFLLVVLISPISEAAALWREAATGDVAERLAAVHLPAGEPTDYGAVWRETLTAAGDGAVTDWVRRTLEEDFGIPPKNATVAVMCTVNEGEGSAATPAIPVVKEVRIALSGAAIRKDPRPIEAAIGEALGCRCFVTVG